MNIFQPDLVIEATSVCNRSCKGCYAPNVVSNKAASDLMKNDSSLFLSKTTLKNLITFWEFDRPAQVSIRGGEPTLHPDLGEILSIVHALSNKIIIETHGRWILEKERTNYLELLNMVKETNTEIKISFDSMHGLTTEQLKEITNYLNLANISFLIAITEISYDKFLKTKSLCPWINEEQIIFQKKAELTKDLLKPRLGVINSKGIHQGALTSMFQENLLTLNDFTQEMIAL